MKAWVSTKIGFEIDIDPEIIEKCKNSTSVHDFIYELSQSIRRNSIKHLKDQGYTVVDATDISLIDKMSDNDVGSVVAQIHEETTKWYSRKYFKKEIKHD